MYKKSVIITITVLIFVIGIFEFYKNKTNINKEEKDILKEDTELSSTFVTDECIDEWEDYAKILQEEIKESQEASTTLTDKNKIYIIKEKDNYINIYYLNEKEEEILYKTTDISTEYLEEDDVKKIKEGIKVKGLKDLQQLLEDFE